MGYYAFKDKDYHHAQEWLRLAEQKMEDEDVSNDTTGLFFRSFQPSILYDYLSYSLHDRGNPAHAAWYSRQLNRVGEYEPAFYLPF